MVNLKHMFSLFYEKVLSWVKVEILFEGTVRYLIRSTEGQGSTEQNGFTLKVPKDQDARN